MRVQLILFLILVFVVPIVSAETWFITQPGSLYSIGDDLKISISVSESGAQLEAELVCGNDSKMIFLKHLENETEVDILQPLTPDFLGEIKGRCKTILKYGSDKAESSDFTISDKIFLEVKTENQNYNPEEQVNIKGKAEKANTQLLDGFFEISFEEINFTSTGIIKSGKFETNITIPEDIAAGIYLINVTAYEEKTTNIGRTRLSIRVKQMPKKIDVAVDSQNLKPGNPLNFKVVMYDQSGKLISGDASFLIENSEGYSFMKSLTTIDKAESFPTEKNLSFGYYKIKAYSFGLYGEREFYVEENEEAEFKIINGTLRIKNVGNVDYNKAVQIKIADIVEIINDPLAPGQEKQYEIIAPDGKYDIAVTDGANSLSGEGLALTGNAVAVKEIGKSFLARNKILAWVFIILVMGMFIFVTSRKALKRKFVLSDRPHGEAKGIKGKGVIKVGDKTATLVKDPKEAEHSLVIKGQRHDTALICLKIKNEISGAAKEKLEKALEKVHYNKAVIYRTGEYVIPIFSPLVTRTFKNHVRAVKTALEIAQSLNEHNRRFQDKINFGISVHSGNLVNKMQDNKLLFTSLGNTMTTAKKIADLSQKEVLLSKDIHEKTLVDIKTDKINIEGLDLFKIKRVADTGRNKVFIQDFLKKMSEEGKKK